jgi:hypothetical protein
MSSPTMATRTPLTCLADSNLEYATLVWAEPEDLAFVVQALNGEHASVVPLTIGLEGVSGSAIIWVSTAEPSHARDGETYLLLHGRVTDVDGCCNTDTMGQRFKH